MPKKRKVLTKDEINEIAKYQWANLEDIMNIGAIGKNKARVVLNSISEIYYQGRNRVQNGLVPMDMVLEYFSINKKFLASTDQDVCI